MRKYIFSIQYETLHNNEVTSSPTFSLVIVRKLENPYVLDIHLASLAKCAATELYQNCIKIIISKYVFVLMKLS